MVDSTPHIDFGNSTRPASQRSMGEASPVCFLGMFYSGLTSLAGSMEARGLHLREVQREPAPNMFYGSLEMPEIAGLNDHLLANCHAAWNKPPSRLTWSAEVAEQRDKLITRLRAGTPAPWGFKDPKTLLTLPFWAEALPEMRFVATIRHPACVAASLMRETKPRGLKVSLGDALELWLQYNQKLLEYHDRFAFPIVCFDLFGEEYLSSIDEVARILKLNDHGEIFFKDYRRHWWPQSAALEVPERYQKMYDTLLMRSVSPPKRIRSARSTDPVQIDFMGPIESIWSISTANRRILKAALMQGLNLAIFHQLSKNWALLNEFRQSLGTEDRNCFELPKGTLQADVLAEKLEYLTKRFQRRNVVFFGYIDIVQQRLFGKFNIAWVVFETPLIRRHRNLCNLLDLVFVPSQFVKDLCIQSGVDAHRLEVLPLPVDAAEFNIQRADAYRKADGVFRFLNVGLEHHKQGRQLLLEAYFEEFSADEPVVLTIKSTRLAHSALPHESPPIDELIMRAKALAAKSSCPRVELIFEGLGDMAALYGSSDCYVSPLYSNGFGLAVLESMACGRPACVTRYGGLLDYCDDANSFLVDVEEMIPAGTHEYYIDAKAPQTGQFALPSKTSLKRQMRRAFADRERTRQIGLKAAQDVSAGYSLESIGRKLASILEDRVKEAGLDFRIRPNDTLEHISRKLKSILERRAEKAGLAFRIRSGRD